MGIKSVSRCAVWPLIQEQLSTRSLCFTPHEWRYLFQQCPHVVRPNQSPSPALPVMIELFLFCHQTSAYQTDYVVENFTIRRVNNNDHAPELAPRIPAKTYTAITIDKACKPRRVFNPHSFAPIGGWRGIRTPTPFQALGFRDRCRYPGSFGLSIHIGDPSGSRTLLKRICNPPRQPLRIRVRAST